MKSRIIKLAELSGYTVREEYRDFTVSEEVVEERLQAMAENYGEEIPAAAVAGDCCVRCENEAGQEFLFFPNLPIPGVEEISAALMGKTVCDTVTGSVCGTDATLKIEEIRIRIPAEKDDSLAIRAGIEGVTTLAELTEQIRNTEEQKKRNAAEKAVAGELMDYLESESEAAIDEAESEAWSLTHAEEAYRENLAVGIDLRFTPEGDMLSEEEAIAMLVEDMKHQFKTMLVIEQCCREWGHIPDPAEYMAMLPPDMGEEEISDELIQQLEENDRYMFVLERMTERAKEVLA